jgi:hypothetical protein
MKRTAFRDVADIGFLPELQEVRLYRLKVHSQLSRVVLRD